MSSSNIKNLITTMMRQTASRMSIFGRSSNYTMWEANVLNRVASWIDNGMNVNELPELYKQTRMNLNNRARAISPLHRDQTNQINLEAELLKEQLGEIRGNSHSSSDDNDAPDPTNPFKYMAAIENQQQKKQQKQDIMGFILNVISSIFHGMIPTGNTGTTWWDGFKHLVNKKYSS